MKPARTPTFDVVTIGAATRDVFVQSQHFIRVPDDHAPDGFNACLPLGAKIPVEHLSFHTGGGGANAAVTLARFGLKTSCITRIGRDVGGREITALLAHEHIHHTGVEVDPRLDTGYSIILLAGAGSRTILTARGATAEIQRNRINWSQQSSAWIYLTSAGGHLAFLREIFAHAKQSMTRIAWNPGSAEIDLGLKKLQPLLLQTDILQCNREEAATIADCSPRDLDAIFHTLGPLPRQALVITDGSRGAYVYARGIAWHAPSITKKPINTTGAGDAFGSAFVATIIQHGDIQHAMQAGTLNAAGVITHMGATAGILAKAPTIAACRRVRVQRILP